MTGSDAVFLDSSAWIEYFEASRIGARILQMMDEAPLLFSSPIVLAEVFSKYARLHGEARAHERIGLIKTQTAVINDDAEIGTEAGRIHAAQRRTKPDFGMGDAFVLAAARRRNAIVVSTDPHFEGEPDAIVLS